MSEKPPFQFGEPVWVAVASPYHQQEIACPICFGRGQVTLILGNGDQQPIECDFCGHGCERATGRVNRYTVFSEVKHGTITGIIQSYGGWRIEVNGWSQEVDHIFRDPESAESCRLQLHADAEQQAQANFESQFKQAKKRTTWNAGYHRKEIQELRRKLEWHEARLGKIKAPPHAQEAG